MWCKWLKRESVHHMAAAAYIPEQFMDALAKLEVEGFAQRPEHATALASCQGGKQESLRTGVSGTLRREQPDNWTSYGCSWYVAIRSSTMPSRQKQQQYHAQLVLRERWQVCAGRSLRRTSRFKPVLSRALLCQEGGESACWEEVQLSMCFHGS